MDFLPLLCFFFMLGLFLRPNFSLPALVPARAAVYQPGFLSPDAFCSALLFFLNNRDERGGLSVR